MKPSDNKSGKGPLLGILGALGIGVLKFKAVIFAALQGASFLKFAVFFKSFFSMFLMLGLYTVTFGWRYAFIVVFLLLIHEMGHYIWMKAYGLDPKAPVFIPFMGAYVAMTKLPPDQAVDAWVALAGPLVGGLTSVAMFFFGAMYDLTFVMAAGWTGCFLNLFQLIPAKPLDGGFAVGAISKWALFPGTVVILALAIMWHTPLMFIIAIVATISLVKTLIFNKGSVRGGVLPDGTTMKPASIPQKIAIAAVYFLLVVGLGWVYFHSNRELVEALRS